MHKFIVGFGALNLDLIYEVEDVRTISTSLGKLEPGKELFGSEDELQSLLNPLNRLGMLKSKSGGGSAANTITALARMGLSAKFIGKVGEDVEGDFLLDNLKPAQTDLICRGGKSGICLVVLDRHQDRFLFGSGNANSTLEFDEIKLGELKDISWIHLSSFIGEPPFEAQKALLNWIDASTGVSLDPGETYVRKGLAKIRPLIERCHILFLTEKEIRMLTHLDLFDGAKSLMGMGPSILICKKGSRGSHIFSKEKDFAVPAIQVEVVDNTGAGDVYNAGFLAGLFLGRSLEESALFATKVAAKSAMGYGRDCYPTEEDLRNFFH